MLHFLQKISISLLMLLAIISKCPAQKKVVFEQMRCFSTSGRVLQYLKSPEIRKSILQQLNTSLQKYQLIQLSDSSDLPVSFSSREEFTKNIPLVIKNSDTSLLHLWMDCMEIDPPLFFQSDTAYAEDTLIAKRSMSVIRFTYFIVNHNKRLVEENELAVSVLHLESPSFGIPYNLSAANQLPQSIVTTANGFTELMKQSVRLLFDPGNQSSLIEMKVPTAYFYNNFVAQQAYLSNRLIIPTTKKGAWIYEMTEGTQIIRNGEPILAKIKVGNKKIPGYPDKLFDSLRLNRNYQESDIIGLQNDCRDVAQNISYQLHLIGMVNEQTINNESSPIVPQMVHSLLQDADTIAVFSIKQRPSEPDAGFIRLDQIYNGIDSATRFTLDPVPSPFPITTQIEIKGWIQQQPFIIRIKGNKMEWREIILADKLAIQILGAEHPEKILLINQKLPVNMVNQLLFITYSPFLANPIQQ